MSGARLSLLQRAAVASLFAIVLRALTLVVIVKLAGAAAVGRPFEHVHALWLAVAAAAELLTYPAYVLVYLSVGRLGSQSHLDLRTLSRIVLAGFGPLSLAGGFAVDRRVWGALHRGQAGAAAPVDAIATTEWAVLAPATWVVVIVLLASGARISSGLLWPWAVGAPAGMALALWATTPSRMNRLSQPRGTRIVLLAHALEGIDAVRTMVRHPGRYIGAWVGMTIYWSAEICAFYAALRAVDLNLGLERSILCYATGYLASRRSLPLGGAGITEILLVFSLYGLHEPLGPSVAAVLIYRAFNFLVVVIPALIAYRDLQPRLTTC